MTMTDSFDSNQPPTGLNPFDRKQLACDIQDLMEIAQQRDLTYEEKNRVIALFSFLQATYLLDNLTNLTNKISIN